MPRIDSEMARGESVLPEALKSVRRQSRVADGRIDRLADKVMLDRPRILTSLYPRECLHYCVQAFIDDLGRAPLRVAPPPKSPVFATDVLRDGRACVERVAVDPLHGAWIDSKTSSDLANALSASWRL
jgi:hypothetical protein